MGDFQRRVGAGVIEIIAAVVVFMLAGWVGLAIYVFAPVFIYFNRRFWRIHRD